MNIYEIDAGDVQYIEEYIDEWARHDWMRIKTLVAAPTPGKAWALVILYYAHPSDYTPAIYMEWTDKHSTKLVARNVECEIGVEAAWDWNCKQNPRDCAEPDGYDMVNGDAAQHVV